MTTTVAAPAADVSGGSSTATKPASAGRPSRADLVGHMVKAESTPTEPQGAAEGATQPDGAPGAADAAKDSGGETATLEAGKGDDKPVEKKDPDDSVPIKAFKERLAREKEKREKLSADLAAAKLDQQKLRSLFEVAVAENERLTEALRQGQTFDERGEELQALKIQQSAKEMLEKLQQEHQQELVRFRQEQQVETIKEQLRSELARACEEFPLASDAEVKAELRKNPAAVVREVAQAIHEKRLAYLDKQRPHAAAQPAPETVAKSTGASRFKYDLGRKGIMAHLAAVSAKG